jgi:hypothetical protein
MSSLCEVYKMNIEVASPRPYVSSVGLMDEFLSALNVFRLWSISVRYNP